MYSIAAAVALATLLKMAAAATTLASAAHPIAHPIAEGVTDASHFPVHELGNLSTTPSLAYTASTSGIHQDSADWVFPAYLLACPSSDCSSCYQFDLSKLEQKTCYIDSSSVIRSVAINQPSNIGLPYGVAVGAPGCSEYVSVPHVNICYNAVNGPYSDFILHS